MLRSLVLLGKLEWLLTCLGRGAYWNLTDKSWQEIDTGLAAVCRDYLTGLHSRLVGLMVVEEPVESLLSLRTIGIDPTPLIGAIVGNIDAAMRRVDRLRMHRLELVHV